MKKKEDYFKILDGIIDDLFDSYPLFPGPAKISKNIKKLIEKYQREIFESEEHFGSFADAVYLDIHDDIQNCGRNPLSKFIEQIRFLAILKETDSGNYKNILEMIAKYIEMDETINF